MAGTGTLIDGVSTTSEGNLIEPAIDQVFFEDEESYNYRLLENSPAIDAGVEVIDNNGEALTPSCSYLHPLDFENRTIDNFGIDIGAYEFPVVSNSVEQEESTFNIYPNPTLGTLFLQSNEIQPFFVEIYDVFGQRIKSISTSSAFMTLTLENGIYILQLKNQKGKVRFTERLLVH